MTTTHTIVAVQTKPASEPGALPGFEAVCSCGFRMATSLSAAVAAEQGAAHVAYMARHPEAFLDPRDRRAAR